jgi:putative sugar O-methyltransferase
MNKQLIWIKYKIIDLLDILHIRIKVAIFLDSINAFVAKPKLPVNANKYLRIDNPRLIELQNIYSKQTLKHSQWENRMKPSYLQDFRNSQVFVAQGGVNESNYLLTATYVELMDKLNLLEKLKEDDLFGSNIYNIADINVSRDLLDSIIEIYFLEDTVKISNRILNILDVGAGYGRLAHRLVDAMPNIKVYCTDAVPESTFICEYYLGFRGVNDRAITIPFNEIETCLTNNKIDIAVNIHSFSECTLEFVEWWLDLIKKNEIKYLMIVPNPWENVPEFPTSEDHLVDELKPKKLSFLNAIESRGYKLIEKQPKYKNSKFMLKYGVFPNLNVIYYMFELQE